MPDSAGGLMWETDTDISASFRWTPLRRAAAPTAALDLHGVPVPGISTLIALISTLIALISTLIALISTLIALGPLIGPACRPIHSFPDWTTAE